MNYKIITPLEHNLNLTAKTKPMFRYSGDMPFDIWRGVAKAKLIELLGLDKFKKCPPLFNIEYETETGEFIEARFTFQSEEGYFVPCHFLAPKGKNGSLPLMVCIQGHSPGMHISLGRVKYGGDAENMNSGDRDFAVQAVKNGYCALAVEQRGFGECSGNAEGGTNCYMNAMTALLLGRTMIGERVWDVMRALDAALENFGRIDGEKIAVMGNSGGGTTSYYAACLEGRLSAAMPSCAVCTYEASIASLHHCSCNYVPRIGEYFDMGDLAGLIAPKKLVVVAGKEDRIFPIDGVKKNYAAIEKMYAEAGCPDNCRLVIGEEGHRFYAADAWPVFIDMFNE
ncbi:MAG: acetylxylan esterase [Oscillospiraceae bacterium]|nr:acetylxylan esterase [Oscillospiraceae bacterium]